MSDKNIDYQMYLDYLDGKQSEPKPSSKEEKAAPRFEEEYAFQTKKPAAPAEKEKPLVSFEEEYGFSDNASARGEAFSTTEKPLSKIEEIERKYHLDRGGEEKGVHLMTDEEFAAKYGAKKAGKKARMRKEPEAFAEEEEAYEPAVKTAARQNSGFEDVYSYNGENDRSVPEEDLREELEQEQEREYTGDRGGKNTGKRGKKRGGKKKKKKVLIILAVILVILGALGTTAYIKRAEIIQFVTLKLLGETKTGTVDTDVLKQLESGDDQNHGDIFHETSASETYSLEGWLDSWQKAEGQLMYNDKIVNVLLIGMDDPEGDEYGRSDAMILVSIDTIHQQLKLTSIWRDTYGLIEVPRVEGKHQAYEAHEKINGANYYGGPELTVKTIESLYKTRIDGYVMTTFDSFSDLIDAMGGINVDVEKYEDDFLQEEAQYSWHATYGEGVLLNGSEALVYSRIRHLDSDIKRTERQRKVMSAMLDKISELSTTELFKTVNDYLEKGYVTTNFSQNDISGLGTKAVFGGWKDFEMLQMTAPISGEVEPENYKYYWGGTYNGAWVWVVDVPKTATDVQKFIYEETFCELNQNRHSISQFVTGGIH